MPSLTPPTRLTPGSFGGIAEACRRHQHLIRLAWCGLLTGIVLWPFLVAVLRGLRGAIAGERRVALVLRDMVVPGDMALNSLAKGAEGTARAVPQDAVLALFSPVIPPPVLVGVLMLGGGVAGAFGASLLARRCGARWPGQALASFLTVWNPYVAERLLQGHWSVVLAALLCPLIAVLALTQRHHIFAIAITMALMVCALTPTGLILGLTTALVSSGWRRRTLIPLLTGAVLCLPWAIPSMLHLTQTMSESHGAELFAARAEPGVGTLGALAGLGGIWNAEAVPDHRLPWAGVALAIVAVSVAVVLWQRKQWSEDNVGILRRLSLLAMGAIVVPALVATGPGLAIFGELLELVPGAGLFRDTQKFVALAIPAMVILLSRVDVLFRFRATLVSITAALVWLQVPALPVDLENVAPIELDERYEQLAVFIDDDAEVGSSPRTLLWPPGNYRVIEGRPALDPLLKILPGRPVDPGYLIVAGQLVDGDAATVELLSGLLDGADGLAEAGIDLVLVDGGAILPGTTVPSALTHQEVVWSNGDWVLYRIHP